jgi:ACS family glucarate transporter-like MFS transporter
MNDSLASAESEVKSVARSTHYRYLILAAGCCLALIAYIHRVGFATAGVYLKDDIGLKDEELAWTMTAFLLGYGLFEVPWGMFCDWLGARLALMVAVVGWTVLTAAVALVGGFIWPAALLVVLRFLFGVFQAGAFPCLSRLLTDWIPVTERATAQGIIWMCSRSGGALAPFLFVIIIQQSQSWQYSMVAVSFLGFVWCGGFWPWFRNRPEEVPQVNEAELALIQSGRGVHTRGHLPWFLLFQSRSVWFLCLMYGCCGFSANFFVTLLPNYLRHHRDLTEADTTLLSGLPLLCGVAGCLGGGLLSDWFIRATGNRKWGRRLSGLIGLTGAGICLMAVPWTTEVRWLALTLSLTFFCNDLAMGPAWASCADIGERFAGTLGGAMNMFGNLIGGALGTSVAGWLLGKEFVFYLGGTEYVLVGNEALFVIYAGSFWVGALSWLGVDVTQRLRPRVPDALAE